MSKSDLVREWREQAEREGAKVYTPKPITAEEMWAMLEQQSEAARATGIVYDFPPVEMPDPLWDMTKRGAFLNVRTIVPATAPGEHHIIILEPSDDPGE